MRFKFEMRRMELEAEHRRLKTEEAPEGSLKPRGRPRGLKPKRRQVYLRGRKEMKLLEAEKDKMYEREEDKKNRIFELEKTRIEVNSPHSLR